MRILIVEDDPLLGDGLRIGLKQQGFTADWVTDGVAARAALETETFDAVVLDLGLPKLSGLDVLKTSRARQDRTPVLILTARDAIPDRITGLDAGADDYLVKPCDLGELGARLRALIRRGSGTASAHLTVGSLWIDPAAHQVRFHDRVVELTAREFDLLLTLARAAGRVLSKDQLTQRLYAWGEDLESNAIEVHIHHLRKKLAPELIVTLRGIGYMMPGALG